MYKKGPLLLNFMKHYDGREKKHSPDGLHPESQGAGVPRTVVNKIDRDTMKQKQKDATS
jgi:hypothetical protein